MSRKVLDPKVTHPDTPDDLPHRPGDCGPCDYYRHLRTHPYGEKPKWCPECLHLRSQL